MPVASPVTFPLMLVIPFLMLVIPFLDVSMSVVNIHCCPPWSTLSHSLSWQNTQEKKCTAANLSFWFLCLQLTRHTPGPPLTCKKMQFFSSTLNFWYFCLLLKRRFQRIYSLLNLRFHSLSPGQNPPPHLCGQPAKKLHYCKFVFLSVFGFRLFTFTNFPQFSTFTNFSASLLRFFQTTN